mmetsp:Transcript_37728/g.114004  ORF Transcript_37728/g.114004 Transcript_37728/m.114004 type:complete len:280 (-) Transcript_37728:1007-1846(-)
MYKSTESNTDIMKCPLASMWLLVGKSLSRIPSVRRLVVTWTNSGGSVRRMHTCRAVSPSQFLAFRSHFVLSTSTRTASSQPRADACIKAVQPMLSGVSGAIDKSNKQLQDTGSSSTAAKCNAVKPSLSFAIKFAPPKNNDGSTCHWPSRAATMRAVAPLLSAEFGSMDGNTISLPRPSRLPTTKLTRSKLPLTAAWCKMVLPLLSKALASHHGPLPLPRSRSNATTQARCPPWTLWCNGVSPTLLMRSADSLSSNSARRMSNLPSSAAMWIEVSPLQSP